MGHQPLGVELQPEKRQQNTVRSGRPSQPLWLWSDDIIAASHDIATENHGRLLLAQIQRNVRRIALSGDASASTVIELNHKNLEFRMVNDKLN